MLLEDDFNVSQNICVGDFVQIESGRSGVDIGLITEKRMIEHPMKAKERYRGVDYGREKELILRKAKAGEITNLIKQEDEEDRLLEESQDKFYAAKLPIEIIDVSFQYDRKEMTVYYSATIQQWQNLDEEEMEEIFFKKREILSELMDKLRARIYMCRVDSEDDMVTRRLRTRCCIHTGFRKSIDETYQRRVMRHLPASVNHHLKHQ